MTVLERDRHLAALDTWLREAAAGTGGLVLVGGEAGVGKTSLIEHFCTLARGRARVLLGACDALSTPRPLGPLLDIAAVVGGELDGLLSAEAPRDQVFRSALRELSRGVLPTLIVIEDAHWADDATLDLLRFLGRRLTGARAVLVVTYRDDEIGSTHPLRLVFGDLASTSSLHRLGLAPLSTDAVRQLAAGSGIDPNILYHLTGGNPFFTTEVLANAEAGTSGIPSTVRDAVLARAARLPPAGRAALDTAAVIGSPIAVDLLADAASATTEAIEACLSGGMLVATGEQALAFRHELARVAVYDALSPPRRRELHGQVLAALQSPARTASDSAHLAHHAEAASDAAAVLQFAPAAARQAVALRAHREAAAQYARALRFAGSLPSTERAQLLEDYAYECYLTDRQDAALAARREALEHWRAAGDPVKVGENLRWISRHAWFLGRREEGHRAAREAIAMLSGTEARPQLAWAYSNLAQLLMLDSQNMEAAGWAERALTLAEELGEREVEVHALNNLGVTLSFRGDPRGRERLEQSLRLARELGLEEHVARALTNLAGASVSAFDVIAAMRYANEGIAYTIEHDLDSWRTYLTASRSEISLCLGDWSAAANDALEMVNRAHTSTMTRVIALHNLGRLRIRRGDPGGPEILDEALTLIGPSGELQSLGPIRATRAEAAFLAGDHNRLRVEMHEVSKLAVQDAPYNVHGELRYWQWRAGMLGDNVVDVPGPYALQIAGDWHEAAAAWDRLGCPYEAARARAESADEDALRAALATFEHLGARPMAALTARRLRDLGARAIPRGPRPATRANPANLTARELEIVPLLAAGWRNAEIADRLFLSPKTVDHHVGRILAKLDVRSRTEVATAATRLGLTLTIDP